jgi:transcriptional regulator with XRE-family HTH domain
MTPEELVAWRKEKKITQGELARLLGVGMITISRWERGVQTMSPLLPLAQEALEHRMEGGR